MFSFYLKTRLMLGQMALMRLVFFILILYTTKVSSRANRRIKQWPNETDGAKYPEEEEIQTAPRIAGGRDAPRGRFPYMCSLKRTRGEEHICGGTLIRPQWVLTAAHCVDPHRSLSEFTPLVHVGSHLLNDPDAEELAADETVVHCGWNGNVLDGADIALIKLHKRSRNKFARLPAAGSESFEGELYSALGWGQSRERQGFAETLQTLDELLYVSEQTCNTFKIYHGQIDQRMLCAVAPSGDTCSGDSGGPLLEINDFREVEKGNPELDIVVGITSHGPTDCNSTQGPGVYTRVAAYREWIDRVIQSDGDWNCNLRQSKEDKTETEHAEEETHDTERIANCAEQTSDNIDHSVISIEHIGGVFSSRPSCLNIHSGRVDCYIRTVDADLFHIAKVDDQLVAQQKLGSPIVDAPECVSLASTHMDCFTLGVDGPNLRNIWWYANSSFVAWREHGGRLLETPSCLTRSGDRIACFARGIDNTPLMKEYDAARGGWQDFQPLTGTLLAPFACGSAGDFIDCLGAGNGLEIHHVRLRGGEFSQNWRPLGEKSRFRPTILHSGARTVQAFIVNLEGKMAHATFNGRRWSNWTVVEGAVASEPECVASSETMFHCFAIGTGGRLMHTYNDGDEWSMWRSTTERFQDKPSCFKYSQSQIRCYLRDDESSLGEVIYEVPPGLNNDVLCDSREDL